MSAYAENGEDFKIKYLDRGFGGREAVAMTVDGETGEVTVEQDITFNGTATIAALPAALATNFILDSSTELTIAGGVVAITQSFHTIDTEANAASDDLDTINGGTEGQFLVVRPESDARTVVLKHGTGNIQCDGARDLSLAEDDDYALLHYTGSVWSVVGSKRLAALAASSTTATNVAEARSGFVHYEAPNTAAANAAGCVIVTDVVVANGAQVIAAQPDFPRKLILYITDGNSTISAGTLDIVGVGPSGEARTESIDLTGGTASKTSTYAYAKVTSATVANLAGEEGADKIALGEATALGLVGNKTPASSTFAVYKSDVDFADEAVGTVDATAGTIVPTSAPNGARVYDFWYTFACTPTQNGHTHTLA